MFGLSFLSPWFLLGLAAAAGPLLLHLFARENAPVALLPTMRFVPRAAVEQTRRRRLQDLWLLLLRMAAVALLAIAFARPFVARSAAAAQASLAIIAMDTSYSMAGEDREREARQLARQALGEMPPGMPVALMTFDQEARLLVAPTASHAEIAATIDGVTAGFATTNYGAAVRGALDVARTRPARLVLISDGQRTGADVEALPMIPEGFDVTMRAVLARTDNLALESLVRIDDQVLARIRSHGVVARRTRVRWTLDANPLSEEVVDVPAGGLTEVRLNRRLPARGVVTASLDDEIGYRADNDRALVLDPPSPIPVTVVTSVDGPADASLYLRAALDAAGSDRRPFAATLVAANDARLADAAALAAARVLVVVGTRGLDRPARVAMAASVRDGQGLVVAAGPDVEPGVVRELIGGAAEIGDGLWREDGAQGLVSTDIRHPVLSVLGDTAGNLGQVRVERGWTVGDMAESTTLLRYSSGPPALSEITVGRGRVFVLTTDLGRRWNTWPLHPTFVPMITEMVRHLSGVGPVTRDVLVDAAAGPLLSRPDIVTLPGVADRVAVNVDPRESSIDTVAAGQFPAAFERIPARPDPARVERETEQGQALWRLSLLGLLAILAIEGIIASRARSAPVLAVAAGEDRGGIDR